MCISQIISILLTLCIALGMPDLPYHYNVNQRVGEINQLTFDALDIPFFLPTFLPPVNVETNEKIEYFFDAEISDEDYSIDIYDLAELNFADNKPDPVRRPLSCKLGRLHGSRDPKIGGSFDSGDYAGQRMEHIELIPNLYAQVGENGTLVRWKDAGWEFEFSGSSSRWSELQQFAARWKEITAIAPQGIVSIYQKSIFFMWTDANCHYYYEAYQTDLLSALSVFNSFQKITAD